MPSRQAPRLLQADNPSIRKAKASVVSSSVSTKGQASSEQFGNGTLYSWKETLTSSPYYASAKEYASKLRMSSSEYISKEASRRMPADLAATAKASLKEMTPSQQALQKSVETASSQMANTASRIIKAGSESISKPGQKVMRSSAEQISKSIASATSVASTTARQVAHSTKDTVVSEFRVFRQEALWWLWWWSLAAIAVYGLATTLPGELLREYHRRQDSDKRRIAAEKTTTSSDAANETTEQGDDTNEKSTTNWMVPSRWTAIVSASNKEGGNSEASSSAWTNWKGWPVVTPKQEEDKRRFAP
jgi:hypothetical protein